MSELGFDQITGVLPARFPSRMPIGYVPPVGNVWVYPGVRPVNPALRPWTPVLAGSVPAAPLG